MSGLTVRRLAPPAKMLHAGLSGTQRQGKFVKISTMIRFSAGAGSHDRLVARTVDYARRIEAAGFPGIWVGDSMGRGRPTLDPLVELAVLSAVTERVELGIGVLQLSLRHPVELAHRVQSVQALSGGPPSHPGHIDNVPPLTGSPRHTLRMVSRPILIARKRWS